MLTLKAPVFAELDVKKSRFLAWVEPTVDRYTAQARLEQLRAQYADARHLCFAFYANGDSGMSDDGEPSGTAGKPMFNVLQHKHLENVLAVVVRYFGGIKLGAGGLTRAYAGAVAKALEQAEFETLEAQVDLQLHFPFALESQVRRLLEATQYSFTHPSYTDHVSLSVQLPQSQQTVLLEAFYGLSPGDPALNAKRMNE
ncbi:MAG: IMPACT family protein [Saccharospirillum sp.]